MGVLYHRPYDSVDVLLLISLIVRPVDRYSAYPSIDTLSQMTRVREEHLHYGISARNERLLRLEKPRKRPRYCWS